MYLILLTMFVQFNQEIHGPLQPPPTHPPTQSLHPLTRLFLDRSHPEKKKEIRKKSF